jgi:undecaprenyl-diphosphatase
VLERLAAVDRALFNAINHGTVNPFFDWLMPLVSNDGLFKIPFLLLWILLIIRGGRARVAALWVLPLIALSDQASSSWIKHSVERVRPCTALENVRLLAGCSGSFSMPSSHAANSGAAVTHFLFFFPRLWPILVPVALTVAYSRVYLGVHYPADALVGLLVGAAAALVIQGLRRGCARAWARWRRGRVPTPA